LILQVTKILFDTGYPGLFLANTEKMGIDLRELDFIVLSHGHLDHSGGLVTLVRFLTEAKIEIWCTGYRN